MASDLRHASARTHARLVMRSGTQKELAVMTVDQHLTRLSHDIAVLDRLKPIIAKLVGARFSISQNTVGRDDKR